MNALILSLGVGFSLLFFKTLILHFDNLQILDKAIRLVDHNVWTHYGNAGSGVGFVPGSFLTAVTALPMKMYFSPYSAMAVILLFHLASLWFVAQVGRESFGPKAVTLLMILYWINPWRVEQAELYNPAYLGFFAALHLWTAMHMKKSSFWLSCLQVLVIGFCAQVHYSALLLIILSLLLWWFQLQKVNWTGVAFGCLLVLASLIPYLMQYHNDPQLHVSVARSDKAFLGRNALLVYPVLKAVLYWLRYGSLYFGGHIFSKVGFDWIDSSPLRAVASVSFHLLKWPLAALSLFITGRWQWQLAKGLWVARPFKSQTDRTQLPPSSRLAYYGFYMFAAMLITAGLSPVEFVHWHLILCFPIVILLITGPLLHWLGKIGEIRGRKFMLALMLVFSVFNLFAGLHSRSHHFTNNFHQDFWKYYGEKKDSQ